MLIRREVIVWKGELMSPKKEKSKKLIQTASRTVSPCDFLDYRLYLATLYAYMKGHTKPYNYNLFAEDLGFSGTNIMHQIINKHRNLSSKAAQKIIAALLLDKKEKKYLLALVEYCNSKHNKKHEHFNKLLDIKKEVVSSELDRDMLEYFSCWYHPVIREMVGLNKTKSDAVWISENIIPSLPLEKVEESLSLLSRLGFVVYDAELEQYIQAQERVSTGSKVKGMGLLSYHQQMLDLSKKSLTQTQAKRRNINAVTVSCSEEVAQQLKAKINMFLLELLDTAESSEEKDQVYQINMQLFPFTEK